MSLEISRLEHRLTCPRMSEVLEDAVENARSPAARQPAFAEAVDETREMALRGRDEIHQRFLTARAWDFTGSDSPRLRKD